MPVSASIGLRAGIVAGNLQSGVTLCTRVMLPCCARICDIIDSQDTQGRTAAAYGCEPATGDTWQRKLKHVLTTKPLHGFVIMALTFSKPPERRTGSSLRS